MKSTHARNQIKLQAKRNVELWIYSFADMYMILSVFFIALAVIYAAKVKNQYEKPSIASAGRGLASVTSELELEFENGSASLSEKTIEEINLLLPALKTIKDGFVEIEGYADQSPLKKNSPFSSNLDLSNKRAVTVAEWLIKNGVPARKVRTYSYGDARLWNSAQTKTNRRVVIKLATLGAQHE